MKPQSITYLYRCCSISGNLNYFLRFYFIFCTFFYCLSGSCEGWKQLRPGNTASGQLDWHKYTFCSSDPACPRDSKIHFRIQNPGEKIYYGFNYHDSSENYIGIIRILDPDDNPVKFDTLRKNIIPGYIFNYSQVIAGPNVINPTGYYGFEYTPPVPGDYYFDIGFTEPLLEGLQLNFDLTVVDTTILPLRETEGRVYCKHWLLFAQFSPGILATVYGMPDDSVVTSLNFNGIAAGIFEISMNSNGVYPPPMSWLESRKSVPIGPSFPYLQYKIFLNNPDSSVYPTGLLGQIQTNSLNVDPQCDGMVNISFIANKKGRVEIQIQLDTDPGLQPVDVLLSDSVQPGLNNLLWNGINGVCQSTQNGEPFTVDVVFMSGLTNLPMSFSWYSPGYIVQLHRPSGPVPLMYWDDRQILPANYNFTGCLSSLPATGCHTWSTPPYSWTNSINTWWYTSTGKVSSPLTLFKRTFLSETDTTLCPGDTLEWHGMITTQGGTYNQVFPSTLTGCDSSYALHRINFPAPLVQLGPDTTLCTGQILVLDAGSCPDCSYLWSDLLSGQMNIGTGQTYTVTQTGIYLATVTGVNGCHGRDTISVAVSPPVVPGVTIAASANPACTGDTVTFTAVPENGGTAPVFQWKVNGVNVPGGINPLYSFIPTQGDSVTCVMTSSLASCIAGSQAISNVIVMEVNAGVAVNVSISAPVTTVCEGTVVTFTASPTNPGTSPVYQWKVNGVITGSNSPVFSYGPVNGDQVQCILTSSLTVCVSNNPASSNTIAMAVNPLLPIGISVSASANTVCDGTPVTFTAAPVNGGSTPVYQWKVNGIPAGANSPVYSFVPLNNDAITCTLTSSETCAAGNPATSPGVIMTVDPVLPVSVSVTASSNPFCQGTTVTFTAAPVNGGANPGYQWQVNAVNAIGATNTVFSYMPTDGDAVSCIMTSGLNCVTGNPALSGTIVMAEQVMPAVTLVPCNDVITTLNAQPFRLKGGLPIGGTYSGPGVNPATSVFDPAAAGTGVKTITYTYINVFTCSDFKNITITVQPAASFTCGNNMNDVRDGRQYKTFSLPNGKCWMQENLDYGTVIDLAVPQTDNCITEKYVQNSPFVIQYSLFQWDELMQYSNAEAIQGLCPPGWHVPTAVEWEELMSFYSGPGQAGGFLKDPWPAGGFQSLQKGILYLNLNWSFTTGLPAGSMYWTSTMPGPGKALARGLNTNNQSVSSYASARANAFSMRCLAD